MSLSVSLLSLWFLTQSPAASQSAPSQKANASKTTDAKTATADQTVKDFEVQPIKAGGWTGKTVVTTRAGIAVGDFDANGKPFFTTTLRSPSYEVLGHRRVFYAGQEKMQQVLVRDNGGAGWLDTREVVLAANAEAYFKRLLEANPGDTFAWARHALAWELQKEFKNAIEDFSEAIRLSPSEAVWWNERGRCRFVYAQEWEEEYEWLQRDSLADKAAEYYRVALEDFNKALQLNPRLAVAYINRGIYWEAYGKFGYAFKDYTAATIVEPGNPGGYNALAWLRATAADPAYRHSTEALEWAVAACALSGYQQAHYLDTLTKSEAYAQARNDRYALLLHELAQAYAKRGHFRIACWIELDALRDPSLDQARREWIVDTTGLLSLPLGQPVPVVAALYLDWPVEDPLIAELFYHLADYSLAGWPDTNAPSPVETLPVPTPLSVAPRQ
jgi:tetratricopeptide (TPR) repeat protein